MRKCFRSARYRRKLSINQIKTGKKRNLKRCIKRAHTLSSAKVMRFGPVIFAHFQTLSVASKKVSNFCSFNIPAHHFSNQLTSWMTKKSVGKSFGERITEIENFDSDKKHHQKVLISKQSNFMVYTRPNDWQAALFQALIFLLSLICIFPIYSVLQNRPKTQHRTHTGNSCQ